MVLVRRGLSKARHQYFTFAFGQTLPCLNEYFGERVKLGEKLGKDSPLLVFDPRGVRRNRFLRTTLVTRDINEAILNAGFSWRPYAEGLLRHEHDHCRVALSSGPPSSISPNLYISLHEL